MGWLSDPNMAMGSIISVNVWKGIPFFVLLLLAGLKAVDREQIEAAQVDGANAIQRFRHVTLPSLRYVIVVTLLLSFISTFNQFGLPFLMTAGGPSGATKLYSILAYEKAIGSLQYGPGIAIAFSVAPLMAVLIWLLARFMRHDDRRDGGVDAKPGIADRLVQMGGRGVNALLDIVFWPIQMLFAGYEALVRQVRRWSGRAATQPISSPAVRRQGGPLCGSWCCCRCCSSWRSPSTGSSRPRSNPPSRSASGAPSSGPNRPRSSNIARSFRTRPSSPGSSIRPSWRLRRP